MKRETDIKIKHTSRAACICRAQRPGDWPSAAARCALLPACITTRPSPPFRSYLYRPHAPCLDLPCLALPRLALPQLNRLGLPHLRFPTCTCPSTVCRPSPAPSSSSSILPFALLLLLLLLLLVFLLGKSGTQLHLLPALFFSLDPSLSSLSACLSLSIFGLSPFSPCSSPPIGPVFASRRATLLTRQPVGPKSRLPSKVDWPTTTTAASKKATRETDNPLSCAGPAAAIVHPGGVWAWC